MSDSESKLSLSPAGSPKIEAESPQSESGTEEEEQEEQEEQEETPIDLLKKKKRVNRAVDDEPDEETENMIHAMIQSMQEAANNDIEANESGLPALSKLKMLDKVIKFLKVSKHHELFLQMNGCVTLGRWLSQLPDGSFPSNPLRKGLLEAIQDIRIEVDNLTSSSLGKAVMAIFKNPNETAQIKKLAKSLIDKWSRMIYDIKTEYTELHADGQVVELNSRDKKKINLQNLLDKEGMTNYTKIPEKGLFNFRYKPASEFKESDSVQQFPAESTYARLKKKMMKKKGNSKTKGLMSVDGKGLDY
jgi:transcription factor SPN1